MIQDLIAAWSSGSSPRRPGAARLVMSQVVRAGVQAMIQALIILVVGLSSWARTSTGPAGWLVIFLAAFLVAA